ncbi:MAG TPA: hypothetical protein DCW60_02865 [Sutterella sp.]|nr:hypothetical protein [Sutterella sp.]
MHFSNLGTVIEVLAVAMLKVLVIVLLVIIVVLLLKRRGGISRARPQAKEAKTLVQCPVCGVYFEEGSGFPSRKGETCSKACQEKLK